MKTPTSGMAWWTQFFLICMSAFSHVNVLLGLKNPQPRSKPTVTFIYTSSVILVSLPVVIGGVPVSGTKPNV